MTSQDFIPRMDIRGLTEVTGSELYQLVAAALPATDKGMRIVTTDSALNVPVVPDPETELEGITPTHWKNYEWVRMPFAVGGTVKVYNWNDLLPASDAVYLKWQEHGNTDAINEAATNALAAALEAGSDATAANTAATAALTAANNAQTTATTATLIADEALSKANQNLTDIAEIQTRLEETQSEQAVVPISRGGTGATLISQALGNFGLSKVPRGSFYLFEIQAAGVNCGATVAATWVRRVLTDKYVDNDNIAAFCTLNGDGTITLVSGTWVFEIAAPAYRIGTHKVRLRSTDGTILQYGTAVAADNSVAVVTTSRIGIALTLNANTTFSIDTVAQETRADGLGIATALGGGEIYTTVKLTYLGS